MPLDSKLLEGLLHEPEGAALDFKSAQYPFEHATDEEKSELLKEMRVPESGLVALAQQSRIDQTGRERLEEWETSSDGPIGHGQLFADCEVLDDEVVALTSIARD